MLEGVGGLLVKGIANGIPIEKVGKLLQFHGSARCAGVRQRAPRCSQRRQTRTAGFLQRRLILANRSVDHRMNLFSSNKRKRIAAWCVYDWANSGYTTLLITVVVIYIQRIVFADQGTTGAIVWAWSIAVSMLLGAVLSPFVGAIADAYNGKRIGLAISAFGGGLCCVLIGLTPSESKWLVIGLLVLANLGLELSLTFYNGFLPEIADESEMNRVSSNGFAVGYFGGGLALLAAVLFLQFNQSLAMENRLRVCIVGTGIWWILFTIPTVAALKDLGRNEISTGVIESCRKSVGDTFGTLRAIRKSRRRSGFLSRS